MTIEIGDIVRFKATGQICEVVDVRANDLTLAVSWQKCGKWYTTNVYSIDVEVIQSCSQLPRAKASGLVGEKC